MADMMKVALSTQAAAAYWGEGAQLSFNGDEALIHLGAAGQEKDVLRTVQRAARRLESSGIKRVTLAGEGWDLERRYAFAQGFYAAKGARELDFGQQSDADARELDALLKAARWVRDITNGCPEEIYPMSLAESALLLIRGIAGDQVTARITAGEALRESGHIGIWSVGRGSEREPVLLELDYNPTGDRHAPVVAALVGKGITFDSGGYSMKSSDNMLPMKSDMGGRRHGHRRAGTGHQPRFEPAGEAHSLLRREPGLRPRFQAGRHPYLQKRHFGRDPEHRCGRASGAGRWPDGGLRQRCSLYP